MARARRAPPRAPGLASTPINAPVEDSYLERLARRAERVGSCLCLGIDPDPAALPPGFSADASGIEAFARLLVEAATPYAAAVKVNVAFFEAFGSGGVAALERVRAAVPADIPFIADAKRADIASTAARQATALFDALDADAVTANPYLGAEAIAPLLGRHDRFVYVLCRTSNPGASEFQSLHVEGGEPLYVVVARHAAAWPNTAGRLGLVVGATAPDELSNVRDAAPELPFLVPGVGAQGGDLDAVLRHGPVGGGPAAASAGGGLLVNVSRAIARAALGPGDPADAARDAAAEWAARLPV